MQIKKCPECGTEYFAHVADCADCGVALALPEDLEKGALPGGRLTETPPEDLVAIREGSQEWIDELAHVLSSEGIPAKISLAPGCSAGTCGSRYVLAVTKEHAEAARKAVEAYFAEIHPEVEESRAMEDEGRCPACGTPVDERDAECRECGLVLKIAIDPLTGAPIDGE